MSYLEPCWAILNDLGGYLGLSEALLEPSWPSWAIWRLSDPLPPSRSRGGVRGGGGVNPSLRGGRLFGRRKEDILRPLVAQMAGEIPLAFRPAPLTPRPHGHHAPSRGGECGGWTARGGRQRVRSDRGVGGRSVFDRPQLIPDAVPTCPRVRAVESVRVPQGGLAHLAPAPPQGFGQSSEPCASADKHLQVSPKSWRDWDDCPNPCGGAGARCASPPSGTRTPENLPRKIEARVRTQPLISDVGKVPLPSARFTASGGSPFGPGGA